MNTEPVNVQQLCTQHPAPNLRRADKIVTVILFALSAANIALGIALLLAH